MNKVSVVHQAKNESTPPPAPSGLQRSCACGNHKAAGGECAECVKKKTGLQRKLTIGVSNDPLEQEADRVADEALSKPFNSAVNATVPRIQRFSGQNDGGVTAPASVDRVLAGSGRPLEPALKQDMEQRFGFDFSQVRVHTGDAAEQSANDVNAHAYTVGRNIVFGAGRFAPETQVGQRLLAHELTHVVQQSSDSSRFSGQAVTAYGSAVSLQRYKVPDNLKCTDVAGWLKLFSPYTPEWAETKCDYQFNGQLNVSAPSKLGSGVSVSAKGHAGLTVSASCPTDLPEWSPSGRDGRTAQLLAWMKMIVVLDKHEGRHRKIGEDWRNTLQQRFRSVNTTATGTDQADAQSKLGEKLNADQQKWQEEAQKAQRKIDPFLGAVLDCPEDKATGEFAPKPDKISDVLPPPAPAQLNEPKNTGQPKELSPGLKALFPE